MTRRAAAEALVKFGLLRRERTGPSIMFLWLAGLTAVIVAVGAASILGPAAIVLFVAGIAALGAYYLRQIGQRRGVEDVYVGPNGERIRVAGTDWRGGDFGLAEGWGYESRGDSGGGDGASS